MFLTNAFLSIDSQLRGDVEGYWMYRRRVLAWNARTYAFLWMDPGLRHPWRAGAMR
jgi:hypothetical protein